MTNIGEQLSALVDRHFVPLQLWAGRRCTNAEDVVQEAFCRLATARPFPERPIAWLYRVVRNLAGNDRVEQRRRVSREMTVAAGESIRVDVAEPSEIHEALQAVTTLQDSLREVVTARIWGELTFEEIGGLCGISAATACRRYQSALEQLRKVMQISWPTTTR